MLVQSSPFCQLPPDVLQEIALELVVVEPVGLLEDLVSLLQTCRYIYGLLSSTRNLHLYGRILQGKFNTAAASRRLGDRATHSGNLLTQLREYCTALKHIHSGDIAAPTEAIEKTLWAAAFLCLENDGRNYAQLRWAGAHDFVDRYVRERLGDGSEANRGWPLDNPVNSLALFVMWCTLEDGKFHAFE